MDRITPQLQDTPFRDTVATVSGPLCNHFRQFGSKRCRIRAPGPRSGMVTSSPDSLARTGARANPENTGIAGSPCVKGRRGADRRGTRSTVKVPKFCFHRGWFSPGNGPLVDAAMGDTSRSYRGTKSGSIRDQETGKNTYQSLPQRDSPPVCETLMSPKGSGSVSIHRV